MIIMGQTFVPKENYAKAFGTDVRISTKASYVVCDAIRNKPLNRAKRLLEGLAAETRSLEGKYYTKTAKAILNLVNSCEKNAEFKGLDADRLFVHASARRAANIQRRRRKGSFGTKMKNTHLEVLLIERGKERKDKVSKKKIKEQMSPKKDDDGVKAEMERLKEEQKQLLADVEAAKQAE